VVLNQALILIIANQRFMAPEFKVIKMLNLSRFQAFLSLCIPHGAAVQRVKNSPAAGLAVEMSETGGVLAWRISF
jgi:hypothetical protein